MAQKAYYVSSTHWDREWYESFQGISMCLVSLFDGHDDTMSTVVSNNDVNEILMPPKRITTMLFGHH